MAASRSGVYSHVEVYAKGESEARIEYAGKFVDACSRKVSKSG